MNAANFVGRVLPNQFAHKLGVHNQMIVAAAICGALAIAFIGMKNAAGVVLIAIIYGFASGACECDFPLAVVFKMTRCYRNQTDPIFLRRCLVARPDVSWSLAQRPRDGVSAPPTIRY